jgi:hypothetical protein
MLDALLQRISRSSQASLIAVDKLSKCAAE